MPMWHIMWMIIFLIYVFTGVCLFATYSGNLYIESMPIYENENESLGGSEALLRDAKASNAGEPTKEVRRSFGMFYQTHYFLPTCLFTNHWNKKVFEK